MAQCKYEYSPGKPCPHEAVAGKGLCIFHLPVREKNPAEFWKHLASYLCALLDKAGNAETAEWAKANPSHWVFEERDVTLFGQYRSRVEPGEAWRFRGFIFPAMDGVHHLKSFVFPKVDFLGAQFSGDADFLGAQYSGFANFLVAQFRGVVSFRRARFDGAANFDGARFDGDADFLGAQYSGFANFEVAQFSRVANFKAARFGEVATFADAQFGGNAIFGGAQFSGDVHFPRAWFSGHVHFWGAQFSGDADFESAQFGKNANFGGARFSEVAYFGEVAQFCGDASFRGARFSGPAYFDQAKVNSQLDLSRAAVHNRVSFAGTQIGKDAAVLLWDLDFVHGTSDVSFEEGHRRGRVVEPAGQVVFRDIGENMNRVSFLHTDIFTDRLLVRFSNVKWEKDARRFIFDAVFALRPAENWKDVPGLTQAALGLLPDLYGLSHEAPSGETEEAKAARKQRELLDAESLVRQDVERIAREIRTSHEKYGNYPDAGDYYVAEMDFRRARTGWRSSPLMRLALQLYKWVSNYGESPALAGRWLAGLLFGSGLVYLFTGFSLSFCKKPIHRFFAFDSSQFWPTLGDYLLAVLFAFTNLVPGWFRADGTCPVGPWAGIAAVIQTILGVSILALFLLAVRRRFRR